MSGKHATSSAPIVVTGCARSGTTYASAVLRGLGLDVDHEWVFGPETERFEGFAGRDGDVSWLAAPFLDSLPDDAVVVHQVRHPQAVVRSLLGIRFLADRTAVGLAADVAYAGMKYQVRRGLTALRLRDEVGRPARPHRRYRAFVARHVGEAWQPDDEADRALTYWVRWNEMLDASGRVDHRHRVEGLDADAWVTILRSTGRTVTREQVHAVLTSLPRDVNGRRRDNSYVLRGDASPLAARAVQLARSYGYDAELPSWPGRHD